MIDIGDNLVRRESEEEQLESELKADWNIWVAVLEAASTSEIEIRQAYGLLLDLVDETYPNAPDTMLLVDRLLHGPFPITRIVAVEEKLRRAISNSSWGRDGAKSVTRS